MEGRIIMNKLHPQRCTVKNELYNKEDGSLNLNPNSLTIVKDAYVEPSFDGAKAYDSFQFVRNGYFCIDSHDSAPEHLVFNRIVSLKSSFKLPK